MGFHQYLPLLQLGQDGVGVEFNDFWAAILIELCCFQGKFLNQSKHGLDLTMSRRNTLLVTDGWCFSQISCVLHLLQHEIGNIGAGDPRSQFAPAHVSCSDHSRLGFVVDHRQAHYRPIR
jgi:hypothetical protein